MPASVLILAFGYRTAIDRAAEGRRVVHNLRGTVLNYLMRLALALVGIGPMSGCPTVPCLVPVDGSVVNAHGFGETASVGNLYRREGATYVFNPGFQPQPEPIRTFDGKFLPPQETVEYELDVSRASEACFSLHLKCSPTASATFSTAEGSLEASLIRLSPSVDEHYRRPPTGIAVELAGRMDLRIDSKGILEAVVVLESRQDIEPDRDWLAAREQETAEWLQRLPDSKSLQEDARAWEEVRRVAQTEVEPAPIQIRLVFRRRNCLDYSRMP